MKRLILKLLSNQETEQGLLSCFCLRYRATLYNSLVIYFIVHDQITLCFRAKKPQPDNFEGIQAGKLERVSDPVGLTLEGYQEFHDEACLAVLNNRYNDGVKWHDVACHFR